MKNEADIRAAEYVLGLGSASEREKTRRAADADPGLAEAVAGWDSRLAPLLGDEEAAPPAGLFDRVLAGIATRSQLLPGTVTVRADEGRWVSIGEGIERKTLWTMGPNNRVTFLVRMVPGALYLAHSHDDDEECYVLSGDLIFDTLTLGAGDYHLARRGAPHPTATTRGGCMVLITAAA